MPGQKLKLAVAGARAKGTHVAHALHDRVIDSLEAFGSPIVAAQTVENREVGERLVHDADDRWLELLELRHGGGAVDVGDTVDAAVPATGHALDERGRVASVVMLGFGRDHLLRARDEGGQESLAVVAVEWLPCVQLDAEGIVVADHGLPSQYGAGNECGAAVDRERQLGFALGFLGLVIAAGRAFAYGARDAGDEHNADCCRGKSQEAIAAQLVGVAAGDRGGRGKCEQVARLDGHRFERDDEVFSDTDGGKRHNAKDRGGLPATWQIEQQAQETEDEHELQKSRAGPHVPQLMVGRKFEGERRTNRRAGDRRKRTRIGALGHPAL